MCLKTLTATQKSTYIKFKRWNNVISEEDVAKQIKKALKRPIEGKRQRAARYRKDKRAGERYSVCKILKLKNFKIQNINDEVVTEP